MDKILLHSFILLLKTLKNFLFHLKTLGRLYKNSQENKKFLCLRQNKIKSLGHNFPHHQKWFRIKISRYIYLHSKTDERRVWLVGWKINVKSGWMVRLWGQSKYTGSTLKSNKVNHFRQTSLNCQVDQQVDKTSR